MERRAGRSARDGPRHAAGRGRRLVRVGLRGRHGAAARLLGCRARGRARACRRRRRGRRDELVPRGRAGRALATDAASWTCAPESSVVRVATRPSRTSGRRSRPASRPQARSASRSTRTAARRFTTPTRRRLGVGDEPFELSARAWAVAGRVRARHVAAGLRRGAPRRRRHRPPFRERRRWAAGPSPPRLPGDEPPLRRAAWRRCSRARTRSSRRTCAADALGSPRPAGRTGQGYSKRETAAEMVELDGSAGYQRFALVGHDPAAPAWPTGSHSTTWPL